MNRTVFKSNESRFISAGLIPGLRPSQAFGVGKDEHPLSSVASSNGVSGKHSPSHTIAQRGQSREDIPEGSTSIDGKQSWDVLCQDPSGFSLRDDAEHFGPEMTAVTSTAALSGDAKRLAGESAADESHSSKSSSIECCNVSMNRHLRPVASQNGLAEWVFFDKGDGLKPRPFRCEVDPAGQMPENSDRCVSRFSGMMGDLLPLL